MACRVGHRFTHHVLVSMFAAGVLALGIMGGGGGLRHATAASPGCDAVTAFNNPLGYSFFYFFAGETISVTGSDPSSGSPAILQILVDGGVVATAPYPGPVTYVIPSEGVIDNLTFAVSPGTSTLTIICTGAPATATPTETPTETPTQTPTETPTNTPTVAVTVTGTETAIPATEEPTETTVPATATSDTTGGVTELPDTGGVPGGNSDRGYLWMLIALLAVTGVGIRGSRTRDRH